MADWGAERAARDENGKTVAVPESMTYKEWKKIKDKQVEPVSVEPKKEPSPTRSSSTKTERIRERFMVDGETIKRIRRANAIKKQAQAVNDRSVDITDLWTNPNGKKGSITEREEFTVDGVSFHCDGKHVKLKISAAERDVAAVISEKYGKAIEFIPQITYPQGIKTPDYLIDGERFDLKSPTGSGKQTLVDMVTKKKKQAPNFIFDVSRCPLTYEEIEGQIKSLYSDKRTSFIQKIVIYKDGEVVKVYNKK